MINWKNLKINPPTENCNICLKVGVNFETYLFKLCGSSGWELYKYPKTIGPGNIPDNALYIILDDIK